MSREEKESLLGKKDKKNILNEHRNSNYGGLNAQQSSINDSNYNNTEIVNNNSSYQNEKIDKAKNKNNQLTASTNSTLSNQQLKIENVEIDNIQEVEINNNNNQYWKKETDLGNEIKGVELLKINFTNKKLEIYQKKYNKNYQDNEKNNLNLATFQKKERNLTPENQLLEAVTIKAISDINGLIRNTNSLNEEIKRFKERQNNSNLNTLLKVYKYLTVIQNFIDDSKPVATSKFKNMLQKIGNLTFGALEIYIGLTGKNLQRVISNFPIDGKEHTLEHYTNAIFWNPANYIMVLIDTALGTFFTATASSWARDVFFNKENKSNPYQISKFNPEWFQQYQERFQSLLFAENDNELIKYFSTISTVNNLMENFNNAENCDESKFQYYPQFTEEIKQIKTIIAIREANVDSEIKHLVSATNKAIKTLKTENKKPLTLTKKWGYSLFINLVLETATWAGSHIILTGSSENTAKENFNLQDWITKDIFSKGALVANISRYFVMRSINNIFKSELTKLWISTNITPQKLARWIEKQPRYKKILMAIPLFLIVTFTVNAVKTEAALVTEYGFQKATQLFYEKFFRLTTLGFSIGVTAIDMIAFAISDFYQDVFNQPINIKKITKIFTKCCRFTKEEETTFIEQHLAKLAKNGKLATFNEEFKKYKEQQLKATTANAYDDNISAQQQMDADAINQLSQPSINHYQSSSFSC